MNDELVVLVFAGLVVYAIVMTVFNFPTQYNLTPSPEPNTGRTTSYTSDNMITFRDDRATVHLFDALSRLNTDGWSRDDIMEYTSILQPNMFNVQDMLALRPHLKPGDLLEEVNMAGYRCSGVFIYDGEAITALSDDLDDYGDPGPQFVVFRDFNPYHWDLRSMNLNNMLVPTRGEFSMYWHSTGFLPSVYLDASAIHNAIASQVIFDGVAYDIPHETKAWVDEQLAIRAGVPGGDEEEGEAMAVEVQAPSCDLMSYLVGDDYEELYLCLSFDDHANIFVGSYPDDFTFSDHE